MKNGIAEISASELLGTIEPPAINPEVIAHAAGSGPGEPEKQPEPEPVAPPRKRRGPVDSAGVAFDPEIHEKKKRKDGTWRKKRGRKPGAQAAPQDEDTGPRVVIPDEGDEQEPEPTTEAGPPPDPYEVAALQMAGIMFLPGQIIWAKSPSDGHMAAAVDAWTAYFREKGIVEPPPWLQVAIVGAAWYGPLVGQSLAKEKNRDRIARFYLRCRSVVRGLFRRRRPVESGRTN